MDYGGSFTSDLSSHLKDLMLAGQQSAKRFDEALLLAMGMGSKGGAPTDAISSTMAVVADCMTGIEAVGGTHLHRRIDDSAHAPPPRLPGRPATSPDSRSSCCVSVRRSRGWAAQR